MSPRVSGPHPTGISVTVIFILTPVLCGESGLPEVFPRHAGLSLRGREGFPGCLHSDAAWLGLAASFWFEQRQHQPASWAVCPCGEGA